MITTAKDIDRDLSLEADVCVVGSGAGGACIACELAEGGLSVVVLEEGGHFPTEHFNADTPRMIQTLYRDGGATVALGRANVAYVEGRCIGGSTTINGGMCWRTPPKILQRWAWEAGIQDLEPDRLRPFFEKVEERIHVAHQDPGTIGRDDELLVLGARRLGYKVMENRRNQFHCMGANNCAFGCPTGGKQSTLVSYIPRAERAGARVYANCRVERIVAQDRRVERLEGSVLESPSRRPLHKLSVRARRFVLACGAIQTPYLLLRSRVGNSSGQVGRNLMLHPNVKVMGVFPEDVKPWDGVHQAHQVHEFLDEGFDLAMGFVPPSILSLSSKHLGEGSLRVMEDLRHMVIGGVLVEDTSRGRVRALPFDIPLVTYNLNNEDARRAIRGTALLCQVFFAAGASRVVLPFVEPEELTSASEIRKLFECRLTAGDLELFTVHLMGTCRMGTDPRKSVVNSYGLSHDLRNLYVADASVFPTPIGVNPMETIMMLATRCAERILNGG
ncbi:MAG: GMC family oxidoreductase [Planctomycetes bacterium]|nr:GMC family oxidoreductase [Planctomycetota bacterium]